MRRYTSAYVPMQNNASALGDIGALSWLAGMPALVCAGLESSTCLNFDGDSRRMRAYALGATGDRSINSCADSRRMRAYTRVYVRMEYKPGFTLWVRQTYAVESPRCARHTPRALRAPSNFEHVKKNRRAIAKHTLRSRCAVIAQCRRQRRRACVECTQPLREWSQLIRECTQLIREWSPHQRRISTHHYQTNAKLMLCVPYQFAQTRKPTPFLRYLYAIFSQLRIHVEC